MATESADGQVASTTVAASRLQRFTQSVLEKAGMPAEEAKLLAEHMSWADQRAASWLGVNKIPQYLARLRGEHTSTGVEPTVLRRRAGFLAVDGHHGFGQVVGYRVMRQVVDLAREHGIGVATVRNTTSAGTLGYFATMAVEQRMVGIAINNGPPLQPAPGGVEKVVGNQAFAVASPAGRHQPLVLDMATSQVTHASAHKAEQHGEPLPEGAVMTADGEPTINPAEALSGMLLPIGGHRGFGLSLLWEVLTGVLAGGDIFSTDVAMPGVADRPQGVSLLLMAIDPTASLPYETFITRVDDLIDRIHRSKRAPGVDRVTVPGERSAETMSTRAQHGIPVPAELLRNLQAVGAELGVTL